MAGPLEFGDYLKAALFQRWNLLYLAAAIGVVLLAPSHTDAVLSFAAAGEVALLASMVGNSRFRRLINSQAQSAENAVYSEQVNRRFNALYMGLGKESRDRFDAIKKRCETLRGVANSDVDADLESSMAKIDESQLQGVNKMLWVYLKLLHTHGSLVQFLNTTDEREIHALEQASRSRLAEIPENSENPNDAKKRKSIEDTLASALARRENLTRAKDNLEFVQLELARIASKVTALVEMTAARHDPGSITHELDDAARSVETTEQAISELRMFSGLTDSDIQAPSILKAPTPRVRG